MIGEPERDPGKFARVNELLQVWLGCIALEEHL